MKRSFYSLPLLGTLLVAALLSSCETVINTSITSAPTQLAVDAWLTDQPGEQQIRLTQTTNYFNNATPTPALSASVTVGDNAGRVFTFTDPDNDGVYTWKPANARDTTRIGMIGRTYGLSIQYQGDSYVAFSQMARVPKIDSLTFTKEPVSPVSTETGYRAQFYANDLPGAVDYYYIRFYRNGTLQSRPQDIVLAYDGAFRGSANTDGLMFIRPIRRSVNPDKFYAMNDSVRVELRSITVDAYLFWELLRGQLQNTGLFATPPSNVPSNIRNQTTDGKAAVGYFMVSPVRTRTAVVSAANLRGDGA
ncbi:DUF4249 domain-containing protein [Fibrivirga algicola]|uniref:DUF4249 domain-containing protein n=1 Tax=Fibrivirga algicola TaxID=2950420 RepID=A0ABX0QK72_9BACT|nr:DUF4249 domain-containing protein [Fibrivirga algicola]ARK10086.1 hypothetical protein A6C57_06885 [Fibrella sp. ES10-3-2-2]NID11452.1 DUF4249 domain-containing protein [Fibrivirga algicola]